MSYPILTDIFRAQVVMQGESGLPEDQFVNNWYFRNDSGLIDPGQPEGAIANVLDAFYDQLNGAATNTVSYYLSPFIGTVTYKVYDLGQAPPRYPKGDPIVASWTGPNNSALPGEVSCCLSYLSGNGPRRKGRLYIGPLSTAAVAEVSGRVVPSDGFTEALGESAVNVLNTSENVTWVQVSPTSASTAVVTEAWVDNALDTQRSRGRAPTSRRRWDASGEIV